MAHLHRSAVALRISGDELDPAEITRILGCPPTYSQRKGETRTSSTGNTRTAKTGVWLLDAADRTPEDMNGQIAELLGQLSPSLDIWRALAATYHLNLYCGLFMHETNEGVEISVASLTELSDRGIELGLDIYCPTREEIEESWRVISSPDPPPTSST